MIEKMAVVYFINLIKPNTKESGWMIEDMGKV